jgi:hypothetical protein
MKCSRSFEALLTDCTSSTVATTTPRRLGGADASLLNMSTSHTHKLQVTELRHTTLDGVAPRARHLKGLRFTNNDKADRYQRGACKLRNGVRGCTTWSVHLLGGAETVDHPCVACCEWRRCSSSCDEHAGRFTRRGAQRRILRRRAHAAHQNWLRNNAGCSNCNVEKYNGG